MRWQRFSGAVLLATCALLAGCRKHPAVAKRGPGPPRVASQSDLTEAEKRYGHSATRAPGVTYQPDVVLLPAGASAIRSLSSDGLTWTLDPDSEGAEDIQPGKVLLLTSRAAGRVLAVQKSNDGLRVMLGPAELTDFVREGKFSLRQPIDFKQAMPLTRPEIFDPVIKVQPIASRNIDPGLRVRPAAFNPVPVHEFTVDPLSGPNGVGVEIKSNAGGVQFVGQAVLYVNSPTLEFNCDIRPPGRIVTCRVALNGAAGLMLDFQAISPSPTSANINSTRYAPVDFSFPIIGMGVPFSANVRQIFKLQTVFTSTGTLRARAYYTLKGGISAEYQNGHFNISGPTYPSPKEALIPSIQGVATGVTGIVMHHHLNVIVGIGMAGFAAGPYVYLNSGVTAVNGSNLGIVICKQETLDMYAGAGVGYRIPQPVTDAINSILRALNIREKLAGSGGIDAKPIQVVHHGWYAPKVKACSGSK